jgi:dipeptidase E
MKLLLLSNSRSTDGAYLVHALDLIKTAASGRSRAIFVPFASVTQSWDIATQNVQQALAATGLELIGAHTMTPRAAHDDEIIVVGGGNTFQLLAECRQRGWLASLRASVQSGTPYVGWSAGANLACPTISTTNDMPIIDPKGFGALGLVSFQINPHYTNALPAGHRGETRNDRLTEYLAVNTDVRVVALPEGDWLHVEDSHVTFGGPHTGYLMQHGALPLPLKNGDGVQS